jgi:hypothetical protein
MVQRLRNGSTGASPTTSARRSIGATQASRSLITCLFLRLADSRPILFDDDMARRLDGLSMEILQRIDLDAPDLAKARHSQKVLGRDGKAQIAGSDRPRRMHRNRRFADLLTPFTDAGKTATAVASGGKAVSCPTASASSSDLLPARWTLLSWVSRSVPKLAAPST